MKHALSGLYVITDEKLHANNIVGAVKAALEGGARIVQYRDKTSSRHIREQQSRDLLRLCQSFRVPLLINDDINLAKKIGADGVHLGKDDPLSHEARELLGEEAIIGISCYNRMALAVEAKNNQANYVAFGRFFTSKSKPDAVGAHKELLSQAKKELAIPVCAIGGITPGNAPVLLSEGADMLAVIQGVFADKNIKQAALQYAQLFKSKKLNAADEYQ